MKRSPLAPQYPAVLKPLPGVRLASCEAAIKYRGRPDLLLMVFDQPASVAGVFTQSRCSSAPVDWCRGLLAKTGSPVARAVVVNAGNANAFTGARGVETVKTTAEAAAQACGCETGEVFLASTGVIGEPLEAEKITDRFPELVGSLSADGWLDAATAIMTTDTYAKLATGCCEIDGKTVTINGIAKGSGMIAPDMATMLSIVVTDMPVAAPLLQTMLTDCVDETFNAITVDSDTSTSDTLMVFATGSIDVPVLESENDVRAEGFCQALHQVLHDLAMQTVRDGEGASKQIEVCVTGAENNQAAKQIAFSVANSPLVKTAIAGEDANWGRVVMAVGKAGQAADRDALTISFGDIRVAVAGMRDPNYSETAVSAIMRRDEIVISVDVGIADGRARVWTCDLTKEYVAINGDYRS